MKDYRTRDERLYDEERAGAAVSHVRDHIDAERLDRKRGECRAAYLNATRRTVSDRTRLGLRF